MKKLLLLLCLMTVVGTASAQRRGAAKAEAKGEIAFDATEHNFGRIPERGKKVSAVFGFTNAGTHPIVITRVATTCKCVSYDFSKRPVAPGAKGSVTVTYNPRKQDGVFYKVIQVYTNCTQERVMLTVRGEVEE